MMLYKGRNKHTVEELEDIIEDYREVVFDAELRLKDKNRVFQELVELVRDIHNSCVDLERNPTEIECLKVVENIKVYLEGFAKDNSLEL
jgi:hypothetical protein